MSILARKADTAARPAPATVPYIYTLSLDLRSIEGKDISETQAVLRVDLSQPAGSRAQIIQVSNPEDEAFQDFLKDIEDPENTMETHAEEFWCGVLGDDPEFDPSDFVVISETQTEAILKPREGKLAELMMQTDKAPEDKSERKMKKKLMERIDGHVTVSKPDTQVKNFQVTMTRPLTMMVVAKLKTMDVEQSCALAPNGLYYMSNMKMHVEGKALGSRFGQTFNLQVSDLTLLPQ